MQYVDDNNYAHVNVEVNIKSCAITNTVTNYEMNVINGQVSSLYFMDDFAFTNSECSTIDPNPCGNVILISG